MGAVLIQGVLMSRWILALVEVLASLGTAQAEDYRAIFWNMHSGNSNAAFLGNQMAKKENIDFWDLSEVANQAALDAFVATLEAAHPTARFATRLWTHTRG